MKRLHSIKSSVLRGLRSWVFLVLAALIVGGLVSYLLMPIVIPRPSVGIIRVSGWYLDEWTAPRVVEMLRYAEQDDAIKAVVLEIDTPGGWAVSTEEIYWNILRLREKKPVVAYINLIGASGGYYISVASNYIYAKPTSMIGSVGASVWLPRREEIYEDLIWTGPFKDTGSSRRDAVNRLEMLRQSFLAAVVSQRGERLDISEEELSKAAIYSGIEGIRYGLVDDIGSSSDAIEKAAELAGIRRYELININKELGLLRPWYGDLSAQESSLSPHRYEYWPWSEAPSGRKAWQQFIASAPQYFYLYMPPEVQG